MEIEKKIFVAAVFTKSILLFLHVASLYCATTPALNKHKKMITRLLEVATLADETISIIGFLMSA